MDIEFIYEEKDGSKFLIAKQPEDTEFDSLVVGMITNNTIPGVAPAIFTQVDDCKYVKYNVTAKIPLKEYLTGYIQKQRLIQVFTDIARAMSSVEEYMIDRHNILLDDEYIFVDAESGKTSTICVPFTQMEQDDETILKFFKNAVFSVQFDRRENNDYVPKLIGFLNDSKTFSVQSFLKLMDEIMYGEAATQTGFALQSGMTGYIPQTNQANYDPQTGQPVQNGYAPQPEPSGFAGPTGQTGQTGYTAQPGYSIPQGQTGYTVQPTQQGVSAQTGQPAYTPQPAQPAYNGQAAQPAFTGQTAQPPFAAQTQPPFTGQPVQSGFGNVGIELPGGTPAAQEKKKKGLFGKKEEAPKAEKTKHEKKKNAPAPEIPTFAIPGTVQSIGNGIPTPGPAVVPPVAPVEKGNSGKLPLFKKQKEEKAAPIPNVPHLVPNVPPIPAQVQPQVQPQIQPQIQPQAQPQVQPQIQPQVQPQTKVNNVSMPSNPYSVNFTGTLNPAMNFGETTNLDTYKKNAEQSQFDMPQQGKKGYGDTTVLNPSQLPGGMGYAPAMAFASLIRRKTNERISINKPVFKIGKERSSVDYFVSDNTAVSRNHANIINRNNTYFIVDNNATNHTYVAGRMIPSNVEVELHDGEIIMLGNEEFQFKA